MPEYTCPSCGHGLVAPRSSKGRSASYKHIPDLPLPDELLLPTCGACGAVHMDRASAEAMDRVLEPAYRAALQAKSKRAIEALTRTHRKLELEAVMGLSGGYLSKLVGDAYPSAQTTACLMLLANAAGRVDELRRSWAMHPVTSVIATAEITSRSAPYAFGGTSEANDAGGVVLPAKLFLCLPRAA